MKYNFPLFSLFIGYQEVIHDLPPDYFQSHMRISRHIFDLLREHVTPEILKHNRGGNIPVSPDKQLQIFLWYLCNQSSMREVSELFGLSISTVWVIFNDVLDAVLLLQEKVNLTPKIRGLFLTPSPLFLN